MIEVENIEYKVVDLKYAMEYMYPMLSAHFAEAEHTFPDKNLEINLEILNLLEQNNKLFILIAFDSSIQKPIGYVAYTLDESLIAKVTTAAELGLYVAPEYRSIGVATELLLRSEIFLKEYKVDLIKMVLKDKNKGLHSGIYDIGYELEELGYYKRI